jgi:hypothetical protein
LVGQANAYLLGGLLVSKFYQTTIARQARQREDRQPYMLLMDEAGELLTSTISEILVGARKYGLGLTLAHQSLRQLTGDDEVYGAVTGSCGTKICFQVGGDDARTMADEFGGFVAADLMNLPKLQAIARVGPRDASFNLETYFLPQAERPAEEAGADLRDRTRRRYGTPKADIRKELETLREFLPKRAVTDPFSSVAAKAKQERKAREVAAKAEVDKLTAASTEATSAGEMHRPVEISAAPAARTSQDDPAPVTDSKAEAIKNALVQAAGAWGYSHQTEQGILGDTRRVDLVLTKGDLVVACEISATTSAPHEVGNVLKCLRQGFPRVIHVCDTKARRQRLAALVEAQCDPADFRRVEFLTTRETIVRLGELAAALSPGEIPTPEGKTVFGPLEDLSGESRQAAMDSAWATISGNMARDRKKNPPPG